MTEDKRSMEEKRLQDALEYSDAIIATIREPLLVLNKELRIITANRSFYQTFHVSPEETEKQLIYDVGNRQWDIPGLRELLENILSKNTSFEDFEVEHDFESVGRRTMLLNARKIYRETNHSEMILIAIEDITERKKAQEQLKLHALMDGLTGIANRRHFDNTLDLEWRRAMRSAKPLSLIMIDIDFFKNYNDLYGHLAGDSCLQKIADTIKASLRRAGNFVARYGGEEFAVILPDTDTEGAYLFAESLREKIENINMEHKHSKISSSVTISQGVATTIPKKNSAQDELISLADKALYKAKQEGRNRVIRAGNET
ncbi:MAG: sensor domain-containing diguanylate cyclase [Planctomycetota bacterium]|jgi:diguanylate cyclase (GGDEF)-like protein/PAS domain S-box-containing protein